MGSVRFLVTGPAAWARGRATFTPVREATSDSTMAVEVTMKMISRTSKTSVRGVMLISATTDSCCSPSSLAPRLSSSCTVAPISGACRGRGGGLGFRLAQLGQGEEELLGEQLVLHADLV